MAADNEAAGKKGQLVWQAPKIAHQREFMLRLMQTPIPLVIVCMRAKYPMEQVTKDGKKEWQRSKELSPKQSEDILFEMMVHAWHDKDHNIHITKPRSGEDTTGIMKNVFEDGKPIDLETGKRLAEWAKGGASNHNDRLTNQQLAEIKANCDAKKVDIKNLLKHFKATSGADLKATQLNEITDWIAGATKE